MREIYEKYMKYMRDCTKIFLKRQEKLEINEKNGNDDGDDEWILMMNLNLMNVWRKKVRRKSGNKDVLTWY